MYHQRADVSFAGPLIIGVGDGKNFRGLRLSSTDFLTSYSYGYFIPRPKELPAWSNLFLAFDLASWALLLASLAFVTLVQTAAYLTSAEEAFSLVPKIKLSMLSTVSIVLFFFVRTNYIIRQSPPMASSSKNATFRFSLPRMTGSFQSDS